MDLNAFSSASPGTLLPIRGHDPRFREDYEHMAYLPDPLPDRVALTPGTYRVAAEAAAAVARLDQVSVQLPNPGLLARPAIRREAVSTSALEGTYATFGDVLEADALGEPADMAASVAEVVNYVRAAEYAFDWIGSRPLTMGLLEDLHKILVAGTPADNTDAGRIRTIQVFIGGQNRPVREARFVPPPPGDQLQAAVEAWHRWITADRGELTIVEMALGHYQFETLHPFNDGNGRLGRLVCVLQLRARGDLRIPVLEVSPWFESHRADYHNLLLEVSTAGAFDAWVSFFAEAVRAQAMSSVRQIEALLVWRNETLETLRADGVRGTAIRIAEDLIGYPMVTARGMADRYQVSFPAANDALRRLEAAGVVSLRPGRTRPRIYQCQDVMRIVE